MFTLTPSSTLNDPIIVWSTSPTHIITQSPLRCLFLPAGTSELDKIHPLAHSSDLSNVTGDSSIQIIAQSAGAVEYTDCFYVEG